MELKMDNQNENIDHRTRLKIAHDTFIAKMTALYAPHSHLRDNPDGAGMYLGECAEVLNQRLPVTETREQYISHLRKVWTNITAKHSSRWWFQISDINAASKLVTREHQTRNQKFESKLKFQNEAHAVDNREETKHDPAKAGWTIENALAHIKAIDDDIRDGNINLHLGRSLQNIPRTALQRLGYQQPEQATPFDEL